MKCIKKVYHRKANLFKIGNHWIRYAYLNKTFWVYIDGQKVIFGLTDDGIWDTIDNDTPFPMGLIIGISDVLDALYRSFN